MIVRPRPTGLQDAGHHLDLVELVRPVDDLLDVRLGAGFVARILRTDVRGLLHEPASQCHDRAGHGGGEQHRLPIARHCLQQLLDVLEEAEIEHLVRLVEHRVAHVGKIQVLLAHQVDQAAGGADHDLDALLERLDLRLVGAAAVDGEDPDRTLRRGCLQILGDLHRELTGGQHHEGLRLPDLTVLRVGLARRYRVLQQRDAEAERLAGAGLGLADDVAAAQGDRQGQRLDREGGGDALRSQRLDDVRADVEVGEGLLRLGLCGGAGALLDGGGGRHGLIGVRDCFRHRSTL